jgi:hypothetical protein
MRILWRLEFIRLNKNEIRKWENEKNKGKFYFLK